MKKPALEHFLSATKGEVRTRVETAIVVYDGSKTQNETRFFGVGFSGKRWISTKEKEAENVTLVLVEPNVAVKGIYRFSLD